MKVAWAVLCVISVTLPRERSSRGNPFRDSDVVLGRVGTDVAGATAWIEANAVALPRAGRGPMNLRLHVHLPRIITVASLGVGLVAFGGVALAQDNVAPTINADGSTGRSNAELNPAVDADGPTLVYGDIPGGTVIGPTTEGAAPVTTDVVYAPPPGTTGDITATNGDAASLGPGDAEAAPGTVTGGSGTALLGPDGTYSVTEAPPSNVTVGESGTLAPEPVYEPVPVTEPAPEAVVAPVETAAPVVADTDGLVPAGVRVSAQEGAPGPEGVASETASLDGDADRLADADEAAVGTDP